MQINHSGLSINLGYHDIINDIIPLSGFIRSTANEYKITEIEFRKHLDIVNSSNFSVPAGSSDKNKFSTQLLFTFDDGGESIELIADILEEYGFRGIFFITTNFIGKRYFASRNQLVDLFNRGHIIGSHSHTHPNVFNSLSLEDMSFEWSKSVNILESILSSDIIYASVPGGDMDRKTVISAGHAGIKYLFTSELNLTPNILNDVYCFGRLSVRRSTDIKTFKKLVLLQNYRRELLKRQIKNFTKLLFYKPYLWYSTKQID